jgi:hypothetical protein
MSMRDKEHLLEGQSLLDTTDQLLTIPDLARFLRVTEHAIHMQRLRRQKPGSLGFRVGAKVLFRPEQVREWLEETQAEQARDLDW